MTTRKAMNRTFFELMPRLMRRQLTALGIEHPKARARLQAVTALLARYG